MSYTAAFATATCSIKGFSNTADLAVAVADYLMNHPDEIPDDLQDVEEPASDLEAYLELNGEDLIIRYDTEADVCCSSDIFDFLTTHFACLQCSPYMAVTWGVDDSRFGYSAGTDYYDRCGEPINVHAILKAALT